MNQQNKSEAAFQAYCRDPVIQRALDMTNRALVEILLRDCFMAGASYAIQRCKEEHHQPKEK